MNCKVIVIVKKVTKDKKESSFSNYYLQLDNGSRIAFKPSFKSDYYKLSAIAEKVE